MLVILLVLSNAPRSSLVKQQLTFISGRRQSFDPCQSGSQQVNETHNLQLATATHQPPPAIGAIASPRGTSDQLGATYRLELGPQAHSKARRPVALEHCLAWYELRTVLGSFVAGQLAGTGGSSRQPGPGLDPGQSGAIPLPSWPIFSGAPCCLATALALVQLLLLSLFELLPPLLPPPSPGAGGAPL